MATPAPQQQGEQKRQKVMVAVDESECSHHAQPRARARDAAARAHLGTTAVAPELIKSMQEQQKQLTHALLDKAKAICAEHGVVVETVVEVGDAKEMICEAAEKSNVDLLILGSHSRGPVQRLFLGSVSNYCMHHAKCPVLVVKKQG